MTTLEAAVAIPLVILLVFAVLLSAPALHETARRTALASVAATESDAPMTPADAIRTVLVIGDSAAILSGWIPGLGDLLASAGGVREEGP